MPLLVLISNRDRPCSLCMAGGGFILLFFQFRNIFSAPTKDHSGKVRVQRGFAALDV